MRITINHNLLICAMLIAALVSCSGCGGPGEPPEITPQVTEEIQKYDEAVDDEESEF